MSKILSLMMAVALSTAAGSAMASTVSWGALTPGGSFSSATNSTFDNTGVADYFFSFAGLPSDTAIAAAFDSNFAKSGGFSSVVFTDLTTSTVLGTGAGSFAGWIVTLFSGHNYEIALAGPKGDPYSVSVNAALPSAVPLPAAGLLFGSALLGAVGFGRKKREAEQADAVAA
jgi:hypothetical protein